MTSCMSEDLENVDFSVYDPFKWGVWRKFGFKEHLHTNSRSLKEEDSPVSRLQAKHVRPLGVNSELALLERDEH